MAFAVRETTIANPATGRSRGKRKTNMAKSRLSAKQIKAGFGGKRRRSALKTKRHAARTRPVKSRSNPRKVRRAAPRPRPAKKRNLGEVVSILLPGMVGNSAKRKGHKTMAASKRKTKRASAQRNAGTRRTKKMDVAKRHVSRSNPGRVTEYLKAGAAVVGGAVGSKLGTQAVLGARNTEWMGYLGNLVATGLLGWGAHAAFKDKMVSQMVIAGGIAQVIVRAIGDYTPYGSFLAGSGVGDYQASAFLTPQRMMPNAMNSAALEQSWLSPPAPGAVTVTHPATAAAGGMGFVADWN
jgi:hypothetical protein